MGATLVVALRRVVQVEGEDKPRPYAGREPAAGSGGGSTEPPKSADAGVADAEAGKRRA